MKVLNQLTVTILFSLNNDLKFKYAVMQVLISYFPDLVLMEHQNEACTSRISLIDDVIEKNKEHFRTFSPSLYSVCSFTSKTVVSLSVHVSNLAFLLLKGE